MSNIPARHRGEKFNRNQEMYDLHLSGVSYYALAKRFNITDVAVRKAVINHTKKYGLEEIPADIVECKKNES